MFPVFSLCVNGYELTAADFSVSPFVSGFHRNEDMKAIDVLPILKEKIAFLSGQILSRLFPQCTCTCTHNEVRSQSHTGSVFH